MPDTVNPAVQDDTTSRTRTNPRAAGTASPRGAQPPARRSGCPHRRGAIDWDTGAWHCYDCGVYTFDDEVDPCA